MGQIQGRRLPEGDGEEARGREGPNDGTLGKAGPQHESGLDTNPSFSLFTFYQQHGQIVLEGKESTTLQSLMNTKLSPHRFWPCHENGLIKTIQTISHNLYVSFKLACLNRLGERVFMAGPKPMRTEFGIHHRSESCA